MFHKKEVKCKYVEGKHKVCEAFKRPAGESKMMKQ
jgi:hypothetical protein